ncbi:MAG: hypothetical protein HQK54_16890 [Oligoflexales bacterium]|nr:hypothetical protein [Oligoflexales bacterium]
MKGFLADRSRGFYLQSFGLIWTDEIFSEKLKESLKKQSSELDPNDFFKFHAPFCHEFFHYIQSISTTYFAFLNELKYQKSLSVGDMIKVAKRSDILSELTMPFINSDAIKRLDNILIKHAYGNYIGLHCLEILFTNKEVVLTPKDWSLAIASYLSCPSKIKYYTKKFSCDEIILAMDNIKNSKEMFKGADWKQDIVIDQIYNPLDIIENAAVAASLLPVIKSHKDTRYWVDWISRIYPKEYTNIISDLYTVVPNNNAEIFFSFLLAVCDFSLNPPILLEHLRSSEKNSLDLIQLLPGFRLSIIIQYLSIKDNVSCIEDFKSFIDAFTSNFNWMSSSETSRISANMLHLGEHSNDWMRKEFCRANIEKINTPLAFAVPNESLCNGSLIKKYTPPCFLTKSGIMPGTSDGLKLINAIHWWVINDMHSDLMHNTNWTTNQLYEIQLPNDVHKIRDTYLAEWYQLEPSDILNLAGSQTDAPT